MGKNFNIFFERILKMALPFNSLDETQRSQMACTFASLLLHDEGIELNNGNLKKVIDAAGVKVAPYWPMLFAQAQQASAGGGNTGEAAPKEEEKQAEEEEEEED